MQKLPNFIRIHVVWFFTNCLKVKQSEDDNDCKSQFLLSYWATLESFLSIESNLEVIIKLFHVPTISKMTTEICNFLLALFDLQSENILTFLKNNLKFESKFEEILRCFNEPRTLILAFKLINKITQNDYFGLRFFAMNNVVQQMPFVLEFIEKELSKSAPGINMPLLDPNNTENPQQPSNLPVTFSAEILSLLDNVVFTLVLFLNHQSSVITQIFRRSDEMFYTLNSIFMLLTRSGVSKRVCSPLENYLYLIPPILSLEENTYYFFEFLRCNVLDLLCDLLLKGLDNKGITLLVLKSLESMLTIADDLVDGSGNCVEIQLEHLGLDSIIDNFRSDNDDDIATVANSIIEIYFQK